MTFKPFKTKQTHELYDFSTRIECLKKFNPKNIYVFSIQNDNITGLQFIKKYLQNIKPSKIVVGSNFYFGKDNCKFTILKKYFVLDIIKYEKNIQQQK